jgi:hypothetical protein
MKALIPALIKARASFKPIKKDKVNPHYKSRYVTMDGLLDAVEESLSANGLTIIQTTDIVDGHPVLLTHLFHESGDSIKGTYLLPDSTDPQKMGSALTYARRYALCAILSVTADEDDDGNAASTGQQRSTTQATPKPAPRTDATPPKPAAKPVISGAQIGHLTKVATEAGYTIDGLKELVSAYGFQTRKAITLEKFQEICTEAGNPELAVAFNEQAAADAETEATAA